MEVARLDVNTEQWSVWPRGKEGGTETQGRYTDKSEHAQFTDASGLPGPTMAEALC